MEALIKIFYWGVAIGTGIGIAIMCIIMLIAFRIEDKIGEKDEIQ